MRTQVMAFSKDVSFVLLKKIIVKLIGSTKFKYQVTNKTTDVLLQIINM